MSRLDDTPSSSSLPPSPSSSSSSSSAVSVLPAARLPPFSLSDFRALVTSALDPDDPSPAPPLALTLRTSVPSLNRKKSAQNLQLQAQLHASTSTSARVRFLLAKFKKRAAALVMRRRRIPKASVAAAVPRSSLALSLGLSLSDTEHNATRNSRSSTTSSASASSSSYSPLTYSMPIPFANNNANSESACGCTSDVSHACTSDASHASPPSPTLSCFSSSACASESSECSILTASAYIGTDNYPSDYDPFAKGAVRVVHRSCEALPISASMPSASGSPCSRRTRARTSMRRPGQGLRSPRLSGGIEEVEVEEGKRVDDSGVYMQETSGWDDVDDDEPPNGFSPPRTSTPIPRRPSCLPSARSVPSSSSTVTMKSQARATPPRSPPNRTSHLTALPPLSRSPPSPPSHSPTTSTSNPAPARPTLTRAPTARTYPARHLFLLIRQGEEGAQAGVAVPFAAWCCCSYSYSDYEWNGWGEGGREGGSGWGEEAEAGVGKVGECR
ncbi:hypothetical protein R3P38DRAFT_3250431 [Favolaschia claudopus]|uniref:Uncharacterized protein n=1 Tax=Favolaschia claudopus TaxID=2862362 RepID=A0AAW0EKT4_9AGAR